MKNLPVNVILELRKKFPYLIVIIFSLLLLGAKWPCPFKQGSEPDGFRGIKWGTNLSELREKGFIKFRVHKDRFNYYRKAQEDLNIGFSKVENIEYLFINDKFKLVVIRGKAQNYPLIKQDLYKKYGFCFNPAVKSDEFLMWEGNKTRIVLLPPIENEFILTIEDLAVQGL